MSCLNARAQLKTLHSIIEVKNHDTLQSNEFREDTPVTRKDYVLIANALRIALPYPVDREQRRGYEEAVFTVADALKADNIRFDRARFLTACGVL